MEESDLVVCHGGNGTIYQALNHGKPIIGIPTIPDQRFNMQRVEVLGVGQSLSWGKFHNNPRVLFDAINAILVSPSFAKKARRMQKRLKNYEGEKIGVDIIERRFSNI